MEEKIDFRPGITNRGDVTRLRRLMARALAGEELCIGFIGGSITQGSLSSDPEHCYAYLVYLWWREHFPKAKFTYVNAGIGGTTSHFGAARVQEDLLAYNPDFAIIEFSVNDESTEHFRETYEGLVRQVYGYRTKPAVMLLHNVVYNSGANAQVMHSQIGRHYDLPSVSMQSSVYPEILAGRLERRDITPDDLHPNDRGHRLIADLVGFFLDDILEEVQSAAQFLQEQADGSEPLPAPLTENCYEDSKRYRNADITPETDGFTADTAPQHDITDWAKKGWTASEQGASIRFHVSGACLAVQFRQSVTKPAPIALAIVDGREEDAVVLDANFQETWGDNLALETLSEHGEKGEHTVEIRLTETHADDQVPFYLVSVIAAGK